MSCPPTYIADVPMNNRTIYFAAVLATALAAPAWSQTGPALTVLPWQNDRLNELNVDVLVANRGQTDNANSVFRLQKYDVSGRWRQQAENNTFTAGFNTSYLQLSTGDPVLPQRLVNQSLAAGFRLDEPNNNRNSLWLVLGLGYAGNTPYADSDALYGQANLIYNVPIDQHSSWQFTINYDGNRSIFPDVPIPTIAYKKYVNEQLSYVIGLPANILHWRPNKRFTVKLTYFVPVALNIAAEYALSGGWSVFGRFDNHFSVFTVDGAPDHQRLFFQQQRLEAGVRLRSDQKVDLTLAGGYAFNQEFNTGFDVRDLNEIAEPSDEPYVRVAVQISF